MVSPDSQATAGPPSGRNSTYRPGQISGTGSVVALADRPPMSPEGKAFFALEDDLYDLLRAVELASVALVSDQDNGTELVQSALGLVDDRAKALMAKWVEGRELLGRGGTP